MKKLILFVATLLMIVSSGIAAEPTNALSVAGAVKSYQIRNSKYGELLRPENANGANGTPIVLYPAQPWKCMTWKLHPAGDSVFQLQNHFTSKTFAAKTNASQVTLAQIPFSRAADKRPSWRVTKLANGRFHIEDTASGRLLTAIRPNSTIIVVLAPGDNSTEQEWELMETDPATLTM